MGVVRKAGRLALGSTEWMGPGGPGDEETVCERHPQFEACRLKLAKQLCNKKKSEEPAVRLMLIQARKVLLLGTAP